MKHMYCDHCYLDTNHGIKTCILPHVSLLTDLGDQCHMSQLSTSDNVTTDSTPLNRCFSSPCQNGGECLENSMTSFCDCKNGERIKQIQIITENFYFKLILTFVFGTNCFISLKRMIILNCHKFYAKLFICELYVSLQRNRGVLFE